MVSKSMRELHNEALELEKTMSRTGWAGQAAKQTPEAHATSQDEEDAGGPGSATGTECAPSLDGQYT